MLAPNVIHVAVTKQAILIQYKNTPKTIIRLPEKKSNGIKVKSRDRKHCKVIKNDCFRNPLASEKSKKTFQSQKDFLRNVGSEKKVKDLILS